ncbi:MAG TPA: pyridoxine 5'-phosphate synthase [bacterium]|nr:pyridoxine 5'-phosphate synthase [bacterium]
MARLAVNIDHVATVRQARGARIPDPVEAAVLVELAGAHGIVVHLREDRRHIQDRDVRMLRDIVKTKLNLEMAATPEMVKLASALRPDVATLVPEKRQELTTEGGLNVKDNLTQIKRAVARMRESGILASAFIDPDIAQVKAAIEAGANIVELHTGRYADAPDKATRAGEFDKLSRAAAAASEGGLKVSAGHGLNYTNVRPVVAISQIEEMSIGHSIVARAIMVGMDAAVREMLALIA